MSNEMKDKIIDIFTRECSDSIDEAREKIGEIMDELFDEFLDVTAAEVISDETLAESWAEIWYAVSHSSFEMEDEESEE